MRTLFSCLSGGVVLAPTISTIACSGEAVQSTPGPQAPGAGRGGGGGAAAAVPVVAAHVVQKPMPITIAVIGTVEPSQTVSVRAQITGELTNVAFTEGD